MRNFLTRLRLGETAIVGLNQEYFDNYGPDGYYQDYKNYGFDLSLIELDFNDADFHPITICDCGCALGLTCLDFRKAGYEAYGIEIADVPFDYRAEKYCVHGDIRNIKTLILPNLLPATAVDCIFCNALMYLTEEEIVKWLDDVKTVKGLYIVTPYADVPSSIPTDPWRKTLKPKLWWRQTIERAGWAYQAGTELYLR